LDLGKEKREREQDGQGRQRPFGPAPKKRGHNTGWNGPPAEEIRGIQIAKSKQQVRRRNSQDQGREEPRGDKVTSK